MIDRNVDKKIIEWCNDGIRSRTVSELSEFITGNPDPLIDMIVYVERELLPKLIEAILLAVRLFDRDLCEELIDVALKSFRIRLEMEGGDHDWIAGVIWSAIKVQFATQITEENA